LGYKCGKFDDVLKIKKEYPTAFQNQRSHIVLTANSEIFSLNAKMGSYRLFLVDPSQNFFQRLRIYLKKLFLVWKCARLESQKAKKINKLEEKLRYLDEWFRNNQSFIYGARGEMAVIKALEKLPNSYILINDVQISFPRAIFWREFGEYVRTAQIDHVLLSPYGIYVIEAKNYSQTTWDKAMRSDYSPVKQVKRASIALWGYLRQRGITEKLKIYSRIATSRPLQTRSFRYIKVTPIARLAKGIQSYQTMQISSRLIDRLKDVLIYRFH